MERIVEQGLLYDFYGELLTDHQKKIYEAAVYNDMSLTEIADENGISKQGVHDLIKRCTNTLWDYENKLHMIKRFEAIKNQVNQLNKVADDFKDLSDEQIIDNIREISGKILEELT